MRFRSISILASGALLIVASAAFAGQPKKGATYKGFASPKSTGNAIQFKVSANGKRVSAVKVSYGPIACQGVDPHVAAGGSATVSKHGTFTVSLIMYFPPTEPSRHVGTLLVTGTFGKHGSESGTIKSQFSGNGFQAACDGAQLYSATG